MVQEYMDLLMFQLYSQPNYFFLMKINRFSWIRAFAKLLL